MRRMLVLLAALALMATPLQAQDSIPPDTAIVVPIPDPPRDTVVVDTVVAPPIGLPTPTEPTLKGWVQGIVNEYAFPLITFLSSGLVLLVSRRWPKFARFGAAIKVAAMLGGAFGFYILIRAIGGTVPDSILGIIAEGFAPVIAAVLTAMGVYNIGQQQKDVVATARHEYRPLQGRT